NHDLYSKINKYINENVKEAVQNALKASFLERFGELSEFEMKEILRNRMFESGSYQSQPKYTTLYEAWPAKVESMVTVLILQASSSVPPLSTPDINLTPPKLVSSPVQELIFTTTKTTTLILPPQPPQQQSNTDLALVARVSELEKIFANLAKKNKH
nr:hypothetical protein [Tanacetum cinerariifolium]